MATVYANDFKSKISQTMGKPSGFNDDFMYDKGAAIGDKIYLGKLQGLRSTCVQLVNDAAGLGVTLSLGFEKAPDNTDSYADDATAFFNAQSIAAAGVVLSATHPRTFNGEVYIVATVGGGALPAGKKISAVVSGKLIGVK